MINDPDDRERYASAELDDDLDAAERAAIADDAEHAALVDRMRAVRDELADAPAPDPAARERALAAARAVFEAEIARPGVTQPAPLARPSSPRRSRWLMPAAAALVGVVAIGGIGALLRDGGDDDAADLSADEAEVLRAETAEAADGTVAAATQIVAAPAITEALDAGDAADAAGAAPAESLPVLRTDADVLALVDTALEAGSASSSTVTCDVEVVATALDQRDGTDRVVLLVVEDDEVVVLAADPPAEVCTELDRVPRP